MKAAWTAAGVALLLAGCAGSGAWTRPGADAAAIAGALQQCRAAADSAVSREEGIDEDILATRQTDWQRSQIGGIADAELGQETRGRADRIVASCMRAKGFAPAG
ncbi:MAG TPA: hypothetical protein VME41_08535 [Stellaceae bacterium]|nr:hypothetical protein [Stellaceae bacterium]